MGLRFGVLGPLRITADGTEVVVRSRQQRALLAGLLLRANREVPAHTLIEWVWDGNPPPAARARPSLHTRVARLRRALGDPSCLHTTAAGYRIEVGPDELDLLRVRELADAGQTAADEGDLAAAAHHYSRAVALWRDSSLSDVDSDALHAEEVAPLVTWRQDLMQRWIDASLAVEAPDEAITALRGLTRTDPFNEQLWSTLLLALHRAGRRPEAMDAYEQATELLATQLGVEPGPLLRQAHDQIVHGARHRPAPAQLPPDITRFHGRADELAELDRLLTAPDDAVTIVAIDGMGGVGKTALAIHWAHQVRGHFPDGQLYLNLRGHSPQGPVRPQAALATLLLSLGVPAERLPTDTDACTALLRTELAGLRVLMVLDNAYDAEQVLPLLPSTSAVVVITGRNRMRGLAVEGARSLRLGRLGPANAITLLDGIVGGGRVAAEPAAAVEVVRHCGGLPLAMRIIAERVARYPSVPLREFAGELADQRLAGFDTEDADLRSIFDASYRDLTQEVAGLFRLLSVAPGTDIGTPAAAALTGADTRRARSRLTALVAANLLEERRPGRFELHDLLRDYAVELDDRTGRDEALRRLLSWCLHSSVNASSRCNPNRKSPLPPPKPLPGITPLLFTDSHAALRWFALERPMLVAAVQLAAARQWWDFAYGLASALWQLLEAYGAKDDAVVVNEIAVTASERLDNPAAVSDALNMLATSYRAARRVAEALTCFRRSVAIGRESGAYRVLTATLNNMGNLLKSQARYDEAIAAIVEALSTSREHADHFGEAPILGNLADVYRTAGRHDEALASAREALAVSGGANRVVLGQLGEVHVDRGEYDEAIEYFTLALADEPFTRAARHEAAMHAGLGHAYRGKGELGRARAAWERALAILSRIDEDDSPEAVVLRTALAEAGTEHPVSSRSVT